MERLHIIGSGNAFTTKYYNTCFAIDNGEQYLLVDAGGGNGILKRFQEMDLDWYKLHHVYVTHEHTDHLLGVIWVIRYIAYLMLDHDYKGELFIYCHEGLVRKIKEICNMLIRPVEALLIGERIHIITVKDGETKKIMGYNITFFDIHSKKAPQFGFSMELNNGDTLCCLGDEPYYPINEKHVRNSDWLLCEAYCLFRDRNVYHPYRYHHSTVKDACELAEKLNVKNLILYHTQDYSSRKQLYLSEGKQYFKGNLYVPDDKEVIDL